jgi:hypothetical protein
MTNLQILLDCDLVLILWLQGDYFEKCFSLVLFTQVVGFIFFSKSSLLFALCFLIFVLPYIIAKLMENWPIMFVLAMQWLIDVPWQNSFLCNKVFFRVKKWHQKIVIVIFFNLCAVFLCVQVGEEQTQYCSYYIPLFKYVCLFCVVIWFLVVCLAMFKC